VHSPWRGEREARGENSMKGGDLLRQGGIGEKQFEGGPGVSTCW
jgi:hypothetical protein